MTGALQSSRLATTESGKLVGLLLSKTSVLVGFNDLGRTSETLRSSMFFDSERYIAGGRRGS